MVAIINTGCIAIAYETCCVIISTDGTCNVQVLNGIVFAVAEEGNELFRTSIDVDRYRMAVTIECAVKRGTLIHGRRLAGGNVGSKSGIHPILTLGVVNHFQERVPVGTGVDHKYRILLGGITVGYRHCRIRMLA